MSGRLVAACGAVLALLLAPAAATADITPDPTPRPPVGGAAGPGSLEAWVGRGAAGSVVAPPGVSCEAWSVVLSYDGTTAHVVDGVTWMLATRLCGDQLQSAWLPRLSAVELAKRALDDVVRLLPVPSPVVAPVLGGPDGDRSVYGPIVHAPFWFAVDRAQWGPVSARADLPALGLWSEVTAVPSRVLLAPGEPDGPVEVACVGPGAVYRAGIDRLVDGVCTYSFVHSSSVSPSGRGWPSTLAIEWQVSWTASTGERGSFGVRRSVNACLDPANDCEVPALEVLAVVVHDNG